MIASDSYQINQRKYQEYQYMQNLYNENQELRQELELIKTEKLKVEEVNLKNIIAHYYYR